MEIHHWSAVVLNGHGVVTHGYDYRDREDAARQTRALRKAGRLAALWPMDPYGNRIMEFNLKPGWRMVPFVEHEAFLLGPNGYCKLIGTPDQPAPSRYWAEAMDVLAEPVVAQQELVLL